MRIFYICYEDLDLPAAWTTHICETITNLMRLGHVVTLFAPEFDRSKHENLNCAVELLPKFQLRWLGEYLYYGFLFARLITTVVQQKPKVFYVREMGINISPMIAAKFYKIPLLVEINGLVTEELKQNQMASWKIRIIDFFRKLNLTTADQIIAVTSKLKYNLARLYRIPRTKIHVIENGVNPQRFQPLDKMSSRDLLHLSKTDFILLYAGSFQAYHGLYHIVSVCKKLNEHHVNFQLFMIGDGKLRAKIQQHVQQLGISDKVVFTGYIANQLLPTYIAAADACMQLFRSNNGRIPGRSMKILEYMACGRPVIVSRDHDVQSLVDEFSCGMVIDDQPTPEQIEELIALLTNEKLQTYLGNNGRQAILQHFSWRCTALNILKLISNI